MANFFEQFDTPASEKSGENFFARFDAPSNDISRTLSDVIPETKAAVSSAASAVNAGLNPFTDENQALVEKASQAPWWDLRPQLQQTLNVGSGLAAIPSVAGAFIGGPARSLLGHPYASIANAVGVPKSYEEAKGNIDTAMMGLAPRGASPIGPRTGPAPAPAPSELITKATDVYNNPAIKNIPVPAADVKNAAGAIQSDLLDKTFRPVPDSAPRTFRVARLLEKAPPNGATVADLRAARVALNNIAGERQATPPYKATPDAAAANIALEHLDSFLGAIEPQIAEANANYSAGSAGQTLDYHSMKAAHRADKSGSGSNIENTMRQEVDKIPDRGLTPDEIAAKNQIVKGTYTRNALRKVGKLGFGDGLSNMYHAALAAPTSGLSLVAGTAATLARKSGEALTRSEIRRLSEAIRNRSPYAQSLPPVQLGVPNPLLGSILPSNVPQGLAAALRLPQAEAEENKKRRRGEQ